MSSRDPTPGQKLGPYLIEGELGRGGMGVVYLAQDPDLGRRVALKVLRRSTEAARQRLLLEARASAAIRHPNVVRVHDVRELEGNLVLVMDYVEGVNLAERLGREGVIPPLEAARLATDLARALAAGHGRRILHRDVKPDNVLLRAHDGAALLTDFGLAKFQDEALGMTKSGVLMGTPLYASPEQLSSAPLDARSDVYSLGALLYSMLCGEPPIDGDSLVQIVARVCTEVPAPPSTLQPGVPPWLDAICMQCLAKAPADRFPSAGELAQALQHGEQRGSQSSASRVGAPARRRQSLALGALAVGALLVGLGALWVYRAGSSVANDPRVAELTAPSTDDRTLSLKLPAWARRGEPAEPDSRIGQHVAQRRAVLAGEAGPPSEAPDAQVLQALGKLGWGRPPARLSAERLAQLPEQLGEARVALERAQTLEGADPWSRYARETAAQALSELAELDARVAKRAAATADGRQPSVVGETPWAALEHALTRSAARARGLQLLRELREGLMGDAPLVRSQAKELQALVKRFFPDPRATLPEERRELVAWLDLVVGRGHKARSFEELYEVLPLVIHAVCPRVHLTELPPDLLLGARAAVEVVYAGFVMTAHEPPPDVLLLGPLLGMWPVGRIRRQRRDMIEEFTALQNKTGEHFLLLYVAIEDAAKHLAPADERWARLEQLLANALGHDLDPSWREALQLAPTEALSRPLAPSWVDFVRLRLLAMAFRRESRRGKALEPGRLAWFLEEFRQLAESNRNSHLEPRLALNLPNPLGGTLAEYAALDDEHAAELLEFALSLWTQAHADALAYLQRERAFESFVEPMREALSGVTLTLTRHWLATGENEHARALFDRTLEAWEYWDPSYELLAFRCWILASTGDPQALEACAEEHARLDALPSGSAIRPNSFRGAVRMAKATLFAAELQIHLDAGDVAAAEALNTKLGASFKRVPLPELKAALMRLRARRERR